MKTDAKAEFPQVEFRVPLALAEHKQVAILRTGTHRALILPLNKAVIKGTDTEWG